MYIKLGTKLSRQVCYTEICDCSARCEFCHLFFPCFPDPLSFERLSFYEFFSKQCMFPFFSVLKIAHFY